MSGDEGFLARWSRRKQEAHVPVPEPALEPAPSQPVPSAVAAQEVETKPAPMPELPSIDSLTVDSDFRVFLQQGVPDSVRVAALRRMWTLDPEIRDFVSPALDYAHDFNVPGGAPGFGPLLAGDDAKALLARVLGDAAPEPAAERPTTADRAPSPEVANASATIEDKPRDPETA